MSLYFLKKIYKLYYIKNNNKMSIIDKVTGLTKITKEYNLSHKKGYLLIIHIENIRYINKQYGNEAGNFVLKTAATRLKQIAEKETAHVFRGKGTSLCLITSNNQIEEKIEIIINELKAIYQYKGYNLSTTVKVGYTEYNSNINQSLDEAESALLEIKNTKNNTFKYFGKESENRKNIEKYIAQNFEKALINGDIYIALQPKINKEEDVVGAEILARWKDKYNNTISPISFIPVLEQSNYIFDLTIFTIDETIKIINEIEPNFENNIEFSINISQNIINNDELVEKIYNKILNNKSIAEYLQFEIVESQVIHKERTSNFIKKFKNIGISFAIDDFGTGYSAFSYLIDLDVDFIKIDKSFILDLNEYSSYKKTNIVKGIIDLAHSIDLKVVAEGVQTTYQKALLQDFNIDEIQGYYYSKPLNKKLFLEYLYKNNIIG